MTRGEKFMQKAVKAGLQGMRNSVGGPFGCVPCPMCMGAIYWARPKIIYYANTSKDAADIGFDDSFIYNELNEPIGKRKMKIQQLPSAEAKQMFEESK
jgi:guanine deaminase